MQADTSGKAGVFVLGTVQNKREVAVMKMPEPEKAVFKDPVDPNVWHWTYTLPGPGSSPVHIDGGYASTSAEAAIALNAARAEGSLKWQAFVRKSSAVTRHAEATRRHASKRS